MEDPVEVKIFATDINDEVVDRARQGLYPESIALDVSAKRLDQFFIKEHEQYRVRSSIRKMVVFSTQSIIKDPPFSKLDLITCRNLLIYMEKDLQEETVSLFHYALRPGGILFLGTSESIGRLSDLFDPVDFRYKIYRRREATQKKPIGYGRRISRINRSPLVGKEQEPELTSADIHELADKVVLERFVLPCVLINHNFDILYFHGTTGKYLSPPVGGASLNILNMIHPDLYQPLSAILHQSIRQRKEVVRKEVAFTYNQQEVTVDLAALPITEDRTGQLLLMVVFDDKTHLKETDTQGKRKTGKVKTDARIESLERDLESTREHLQSTIEELETANEELKSSNEEVQSTNEELQGTNEELSTVNSELERKIEQLTVANNDLTNLFASTEIGIIFLDEELCIQRFSPSAKKIFNLIPSDIGRPISDITMKIAPDNFYEEIKKVFVTLTHKDFDITMDDGTLCLLRLLPYRTQENIIEGVVITFSEITILKDFLSAQRLATVVADSNDAIILHNPGGRIVAWNRGAEKMYGYDEAEALQMNVNDLIPPGKKSEYATLINQVTSWQEPKGLRTQRIRRDGGIIQVWLKATRQLDQAGNITAIATTERDLSELESLIEERNRYQP